MKKGNIFELIIAIVIAPLLASAFAWVGYTAGNEKGKLAKFSEYDCYKGTIKKWYFIPVDAVEQIRVHRHWARLKLEEKDITKVDMLYYQGYDKGYRQGVDEIVGIIRRYNKMDGKL